MSPSGQILHSGGDVDLAGSEPAEQSIAVGDVADEAGEAAHVWCGLE